MIRFFLCRAIGIGLLALPALPAYALVNGSLVSDSKFSEQYPWAVVVVSEKSGGICGGVLVAPRWVLTAAHCTGKRKFVLFGHAKRSAAMRINVAKAIRHPEFSRSTMRNDVGLLYLDEPVPAPPAVLPTVEEARVLLLPGMPAKLVGWGKTETSPEPSDRLIEGAVRLEQLYVAGSVFTYSFQGGGPCGRDSGSPMLMRTLDGRQLIVGIASRAAKGLCSQGGGQASYINTAAVHDFIVQHVQPD